MRLIYITRTFVLDDNPENCSGLRNYIVNLLKKKYEVLVVTPGYNSDVIVHNNGVIAIPYRFKRADAWYERIGIYEDYLERWVNEAEKYLTGIVNSDDIVMAVSGGELGSFMLASRLKKNVGCKIIANFHDPIDATMVNGSKSTLKFHVKRDKVLGNYLSECDAIITCCNTYKEELKAKYKDICRIQNIYRGYRGEIAETREVSLHKPIRLVYAGSMSQTQGVERFISFFLDRKDVELLFIGNASLYVKKAAETYDNISVMGPMSHDKYEDFIKSEADIGLVSLRGKEFAACVPSKIFELINYEIPIFALLPDGDAADIINNGYGVACSDNSKEIINQRLDELLESRKLLEIRQKMNREKAKWKMETLFNDVYKVVDNLCK